MELKYQKLRILSYTNPDIESEVAKRTGSYSTIKFGFSIYPFLNGYRKTEKKFELFYLILPEHLLMTQEITDNSAEIVKLSESIKGIARRKIMMNYLVEEIQGTNETEGIRSSREEITEVINRRKSKNKIRFQGIVNMYMNIYYKKSEPIKEPEDIRKIYKNLLEDDIEQSDLPDGKIFRSKSVSIMDGDTVVHRGNPDEKSIHEDTVELIDLMNSTSTPFLIKGIVTHYILEYIHPFYDGNGRLGRYVLSQYLARKLDFFTGVSLSNTVNKNKKTYSEAFSEVSHPKNYGEITFFVDTMLKLIIKGQKSVIRDLEENKAKLEYFNNKVVQLEISDNAKNILFALIQDREFISDHLSDNDLGKAMELSRYVVGNCMKKELEPKNFVKKISNNPIIHELSDEFIDYLNN